MSDVVDNTTSKRGGGRRLLHPGVAAIIVLLGAVGIFLVVTDYLDFRDNYTDDGTWAGTVSATTSGVTSSSPITFQITNGVVRSASALIVLPATCPFPRARVALPSMPLQVGEQHCVDIFCFRKTEFSGTTTIPVAGTSATYSLQVYGNLRSHREVDGQSTITGGPISSAKCYVQPYVVYWQATKVPSRLFFPGSQGQ